MASNSLPSCRRISGRCGSSYRLIAQDITTLSRATQTYATLVLESVSLTVLQVLLNAMQDFLAHLTTVHKL